MRIWLHVVGMFLLGSLGLLCVGFLYDARVGREPGRDALPAPNEIVGTTGGTSVPASPQMPRQVLDGLSRNLRFFAATNESTTRPQAMSALDRAYRLTQVFAYAIEQQGPAADLRERVVRARELVQNGRDRAAMHEALAATLELGAVGEPRARQGLHDPSQYAGATCLDVNGRVVGHVTSVTDGRLVVEQGGIQDLLGFIDLRSGATRIVDLADTLPGEPRTVGSTMVVIR